MDIAELKDTKADLLNRAEQLKAQRQTFSDVFNGGNPLTVGEFNILSGILERSTDKEADTNRFTQALIYNRQQGIDLADAYANIEALNEAQMGKKGEYTKAWTQAVSDSFRVGELNKQRSELGMKFHDLEAAGKDTAEIMAEIDAIDAQIEQLQDNTPRGLGVTLMKWAAGTIPYTGDVLLKGATAGMAAALVATGVGAVAGVPMLAAATLGTSYTLASLAYGGAALAFGWKRTADLSKGAMYYDLRKQGVEKNIAEWASSADGWVQGAVENFLGLTPMAAKAVGNALGREAATGITTRVLSKMYANGIIGGLAAGATKWVQGAAGEGAEEFFQSIADSVTEYAVAEISDSGYTFDKTAKEVLKQALYEGVAGFGSALVLGGLPAAINTRADMGYSRNLKNEAELIPSKEMFIRRHQNDEQFSELTAAQRKDTLGEIYDKNHTIEGVSNAEAANLDTDYLAINESADEEESEAQATDTPQEPIKRRKDHRLHTQESTTVTENADGSESHTLKLGSADSRRRYGRIEFTVNGDTVTIDNVYLKAGQEALTGEFVTELMRRYEGYNIEWQPTTESQIKVRDQLIKDNRENPGQLQMFKGRSMDEVLEAAGYIKEKLPNLNRHEATVAAGLMRVIAEGRGRTLQQFIHDDIQFKTFAEAVANDVMSEQEAALNKGAYQLIENGTKAIIYVGKEGDFSTLFHEVVHFISQTSPQSKDLATALKGAADTDQFRQYLEQHKRIMDSTGLKTADDIINAIKEMSDNPMEWNRAQNEIVAVLGETYAQEGRTFNSELKGLFDKIIDFFMKIYRMMKQNALLNDDIVKAYDALLAGNPELKQKYEAQEQSQSQTESQVLMQGKPTAEEQAEAERQYAEVEAQYKGTPEWLKAPNGQPTKLTERQWVQVRTPLFKAWFGDWEADPQNASKVVDENGEPRVVYHGTLSAGFDVFRYDKNIQTGTDYGKAFYFTADKEKAKGYAYSLKKDPEFAEYQKGKDEARDNYLNNPTEENKQNFLNYKYNGKTLWDFMEGTNTVEGSEVKEVFLSLKDPLIENAHGSFYSDVYTDYFTSARNNNNDGLIVNNVIDNPRGEPRPMYVAIAFNENQIKSATDNVGTFNEQNPSILFQIDTEYLDAVNSGDMAKAQAMVDARAREMGYNSPKLYHGTKQFGFTTVDVSKSDDQVSFFATDRLETAETYSGEETATSIGKRKQISEIKEEINQNADKMLDLLKKIAPKKFGRFTISDIANEIISNIEWENFNSIGFDPFFGLSKLYELFNMAVSDNENLSKLSVGDLDQTQEYKTYSKIFDDIAKVLTESAGNYSLYAKTDKFLKIDAKGANWNKIILPKNIQNRLKKYQVPNWEYYQKGVYKVQVNTRELSYFARQLGYRGVEIKNVVDNGGRGNKYNGYLQLPPATVYIFFDPQSQVKSADPVTYDDNGNVIPLSERFNPQHTHQNLLFQSAYHGSGASFDKFDTDFMGTGEGAQAFGWGIYLTQSEGIARDYARRMARGSRYELIYKDKILPEESVFYRLFDSDIFEDLSKGNKKPFKEEILRLIERFEKNLTIDQTNLEEINKTIEDITKGTSYEEIYNKYEDADNTVGQEVRHIENNADRDYTFFNIKTDDEVKLKSLKSSLEYYKERVSDDIDALTSTINELKTTDVDNFSARLKLTRNLYTASIPDDTGSNYLYWDRPIGKEALEKIRNAYIPELVERNQDWLKKGTKEQIVQRVKSGMSFDRELASPEETGKQIYDDLINLLGSDKDASEFLNRAGFVGIDYPANSMSGGNRYGKRNFVIFNADDITIDNHLLFQSKSQQEIEDSLIADAKGQTLDEWLDFNRFLGDSNLDEAALTAIWEKANHVTEVEGEKVVEAAPLSEEEKDTAFRAMIDTDDGVRKFIQDLRSVDAYIRDIEREGMSDEEDMDFLNRLADASKRIETEAAPFIKNLLKNNNELSEESIKKVRGMVEKNLAAYRDLYAAASGNENLTSNIEALPFIDEPTRERMQTMSIAEKRRLVDNLEAQELKKKILKGEELYEGEAEKVVKMLDAEIQKLEGEKEALKASLDNKQDWLDIKEKKLLNAAEEAKATEKAINKLERNIRSRLDKGMRISKEDYQKLAGWKDKLELLQDDVNALNKQTKLKAILQEREKYRQKQAELKQKQKERQFAKKVHDYKVKLASYIMKKPSKTVNWEQAEQILALQAVFGRTSGYDNFFINMNGKRLNLTAFRGMIDRGEINIAGLTDYQLKRYFNKSLAEYTVQDLETLADTVRYLTEQGRHEWQAKVDQRAFEARQWQNLLINEIAGNPRYTDAGDEPLPETGESEKKKRTFAQLVRTGWYKTLNMARKAQILDGNRKATAYRLLVEEKRAVQEREALAIRKRMQPIFKLMKDLGVKAEDFYEELYTLKIGKNEQHYTTSQLIYGLKAQLEQRNMEAFVYGNLISQREKEFYGHNDNSLRLIGEARLDDFIKQAQAILAGKENIMKVAEAIWNDWQDKDNFARLNRAAIDEYNMPVDPVQFYMPIARKDFNGTELAAKIADDLYNTNAGKGMTAVEKGMTKARLTISPDHQMPVDMNYFKLWTDSVADQEHFIASNAYVRKLNRVFKALGSKDLRANIEAVYGQGMMNDIDNYINEVANPNINTDTQGVNKFLSFLRGALYPAYLAFKSSSVILQMITSPAPFLREVGPVELAKGLIQMSLHPVETWRYVTELSATMEKRSMNPLIDEVKKAAEKYTDPKYKQLWHKIQETGTMGLEMADRWAVTAGWLAVFDKKKAEYEAQGMEAKQAEREAVKYADAVVLETQPTGDKTELAPLFKVGGPAWQAFTQFQVSLNVIWNNLTYDVANSDFRNHEVRKAMGTLIGYALAGALLYSVQEGFDDDDDAEDIILKLLYGATTQYTSSIPLVSSNIDNIIKSKMTGEVWYSRGSQLYPGLDALAQGVATGNVDKLARAVGIFSGAPVSGWKEFEHSFYNRKKGEWRFYPKAFLGRREK